MARDRQQLPPDVTFDFGHDPGAPGAARRVIAPMLREDGALAEDVTLTASELVTNVVEHTEDGGRLDAWDEDPLLLQVEDSDVRMPAMSSDPDEGGGRGLRIVEHLADDWGVEQSPTGKVVWAKFRRPHRGGHGQDA